MALREVGADYIQAEYIAPKHFEKLNGYLQSMMRTQQDSEDPSRQRIVRVASRSFQYVVSFRKTGRYSVLMLNEGAAAKPHSILDKTIKPGAINSEEEGCKQLLLLYGLVARRRARTGAATQNSNDPNTKEIDALCCTPDKSGRISVLERGSDSLLKFLSKATGISEDKLGRLNSMSNEDILKSMVDKTSDFYAGKYANKYIAGDYDIHDLVSKTTQPHPVVSESEEEFMALNDLNSLMMTGEHYRGSERRFILDPFYPIQHGSQYNYVAHMWNVEPDEKIVSKVALPDLPILMLRVRGTKIEWQEIDDVDSLNQYYSANSIKVKEAWRDDTSDDVKAAQCVSAKEYKDGIASSVNKQKGH